MGLRDIDRPAEAADECERCGKWTVWQRLRADQRGRLVCERCYRADDEQRPEKRVVNPLTGELC